MYVYIKETRPGSKGRRGKEWQHDRVKQACSYYARTLRIPHPKVLTIFVFLCSASDMSKRSQLGSCSPINDHTCVDGKPTAFHISLRDDKPWSEMAMTLAHEMVHAHQYATGRLKRTNTSDEDSLYQWEGGHFVEEHAMPYHERPWENEADRMKRSLAEGFFKVESPTGITLKGI